MSTMTVTKKKDLGVIAFAKVKKLEKEVSEIKERLREKGLFFSEEKEN